MPHLSTKTYGHAVGFSCAFRQWRADSHCRLLHGYALGFKFVFEADELDARNWVVDFGSLKSLKQTLEDTFDHTTIVAEDDPQLPWFREGERLGTLRLVVLPAGGCERFAEYVAGVTEVWLKDNGYAPRVRLRSVEVMEHGANSALYEPPYRLELKALREVSQHLPDPPPELAKIVAAIEAHEHAAAPGFGQAIFEQSLRTVNELSAVDANLGRYVPGVLK